MSFGFGLGFPRASSFNLEAAVLALFAGTPGYADDLEDWSTLFQDAAGTTPVTALEQPVGLILDKSQGLVLKPELVTNGDFSNGTTGWTSINATLSAVSGVLRITKTSVNGQARTTVPTVIGKVYRVKATLTNRSVAAVVSYLDLGSSAGGLQYARTAVAGLGVLNGSVTVYFTAAATTAYLGLYSAEGTGFEEWDNISVRELPGNHAFHKPGDVLARAVISRRVNLLTKTEDFADSYWSKNVAVSVTNGSGYSTVSVPNTIGGGINIVFRQSISTLPRLYYSLMVRGPVGRSITLADDYGNSTVAFTGEWQKINFTSSDGGGGFHQFYIRTASANQTYTFDITQASLVPADLAALPYQRVNTTTDYDGDASKFPTFLRTDGVDDCYQTNAINFTGTDKMTVVAGVRKLSDATQEFLGLSAVWTGSPGTFAAYSESGVVQYASASRGSAAAAANQVASVTSGYAAPVSTVLSSSHDIAGDLTTLRLNGVAQTPATGDKGTGNFGNYPLYFFRRGGTTLPFNGFYFGSLIIGRTLNASELALVERYMAQKTKTVTLA